MVAKYLVLVALLLVLEVQCQDLEEFPIFVAGNPSNERRGRAEADRDATAVCTTNVNSFQRFCNNVDECIAKSVLACNGAGTAGTPEPCPADMPFCRVTGPGEATCQAEKSESCQTTDTVYKCTGKGYFPDPSNCKKYYHCSYKTGDADYTSKSHTCPDLHVFDPSGKDNEKCRFTNNNQCVTVKCTAATANTFVPMVYPWFPKALGQYVVRCKADNSADVFRCNASFELVPNTYPVQCKPVCRGLENIAHPFFDNKYYKCYRTGTKIEPFIQECNAGEKFDDTKKKCVSA